MVYDTIIIGASAAGISAAIYAARRGLRFVIISNDFGGEVLTSGEIGNYPGVKDTDGFALTDVFREQMKEYNVEIHEGERVLKVEKTGERVRIMTENGTGPQEYVSKSAIIATGIHPRELNIPGEKELRGRGVTYCTVCDGPLYKGKVTASIGGGNSALESALMMALIASKVYLVNIHDKFYKGDSILVEKVMVLPIVEIVPNAKTMRILGEKQVEGFVYEDTETKTLKTLAVQGVMVHIGMVPNSDIVEAEKNSLKEIVVDKWGRTSVPGIFAAGDVADVPYKQIAIAAGSGVTAALSMVDYLNKLKD